MKINCSNQRKQGLTFVEAVFVTFLLSMLAIVLLPALLVQRHSGAQRINCSNNLKQVGLAFRIWEGDNNDKYPMSVSVTNGGAMEAVARGDAIMAFRVMSNELSTAKILCCPEDRYRHFATNFNNDLTASTVSYFVNVDATESDPQGIMSGDDNFVIGGVPVKSGLLVLSSNAPFAWSRARHKFSGYILMADGSVQGTINSAIKTWFFPTNSTAMRLAIP